MKRKWALGLCEGLMTQAVLSLPEIIIFLFFSWLLSNHHGKQQERNGRQRGREKRKSNFSFLLLLLGKNCLSYLHIMRYR